MAKKMYIGIDEKARKIKKGYIGISNVAKKIKKGYIGIGGVARPFSVGGVELAYYGIIQTGSKDYIFGINKSLSSDKYALFSSNNANKSSNAGYLSYIDNNLKSGSLERLTGWYNPGVE